MSAENNGIEHVAENPVVQVAKEGDAPDEERIRTLRSGVRVKLNPVPDMLVQRVMSKIKKPKVPMWYNPDKERQEPNPQDPDYQDAVRVAEEERGIAAMDTSIMFGAELVDGLPDDRSWIRKLRYMGIEVDEDDEFELEFAYLKYIAFANSADMEYVLQADLQERDIENAGATFRGDEARRADPDDSAEKHDES